MKKLTKALVGGLAFIGCAGLLAGCGNNVNSQMSGLHGSYMFSEADSPALKAHKLTSNQKENAPRLLYHFKGNKIYAQSIQPNLYGLINKQANLLNKQAKSQIAKMPTKRQKQAKLLISQRMNMLIESEREHPKTHDTFRIKSVKKQGHLYKLHGYNTAYTKEPTNRGSLKSATHKGKNTTLTFKRNKNGIQVVPKGATKSLMAKDPTFKKVTSNTINSELKDGKVNKSQVGY